jgi:hypothetical protein
MPLLLGCLPPMLQVAPLQSSLQHDHLHMMLCLNKSSSSWRYRTVTIPCSTPFFWLEERYAIVRCRSCSVLFKISFCSCVPHIGAVQLVKPEACKCELTWRPSRALRSRWLRCTCVRHVAQALCKEEAKQARLAFCTLARFSLLTTINSFQLAKALHTHMSCQNVD